MHLPLAAGIGQHKNSRTRANTSAAPLQTAVVHHQLPFRSEAYTLAYYLGTAEGADYTSGQHMFCSLQAA